MPTAATMLPPWPFPAQTPVADIGEHAIIRWIRDAAATHPPGRDVIVGIGDDAAVVAAVRNHLDVVTTDSHVEDVHFAWHLSDPSQIGARALHVNLSDVAAMGAEPRYALLSLGLPPAMPGARLHALLTGVLDAALRSRVALIGGNISHAAMVTMDVTVSGSVKRRHLLQRRGARAGDEIYVSGTMGAAAAGLAWLSSGRTTDETMDGLVEAVARYRTPEARVFLGVQVARNRAASSCMDTSDGLADALQQMSAASGVGMRIERHLLPLQAAVFPVAARLDLDPWALALAGGDDYELVFTVPRRVRRRFLHATGRTGMPPVTRIGVCTKASGIEMVDSEGNTREWPAGHEHFVTTRTPGA